MSGDVGMKRSLIQGQREFISSSTATSANGISRQLTKKLPVDYAIQSVFSEFVRIAELKMHMVLTSSLVNTAIHLHICSFCF
jgi:hypothetical protein